MLNLKFPLAGVASALALTLFSGVAHSQGDTFKPVIASTVRVLALKADGSASYGTGFVVAAADRENNANIAVVVTARHVVLGAVKVTIVEPGSPIDQQDVATVVNSTVERDIAFLEVRDLTQKPLTLTRALPSLGERVLAAGYATASDAAEAGKAATYASLKSGGFSKSFRGLATEGAHAPIDQIEFDAPVLGGYSGGPLVNDCGAVIGLTVKDGGHINLSKGAQISVAQGVSVAIASNEIIKAATDANVKLLTSDAACPNAEKAAPPPPPPPPCSKAKISVEADGRACTPIPTLKPMVSRNVLIIAAAAALLLIIGVIVTLLLRRNSARVPVSGGSYDSKSHTGLVSEVSPTSGKLILLEGRGPSGDPIRLQFSPGQLSGSGVMLGVEGDPGGIIPDTRSKTLISRKHARLLFENGEFVIEDNKSTNKTKVSGQVVPPSSKRSLVSGDRLQLADVTLNVTIS